MSVVVRIMGRCSFPSGEINSLTIHERTWGTVLSTVASWITRKGVILSHVLSQIPAEHFEVPFALVCSPKSFERTANQRGGGGGIGITKWMRAVDRRADRWVIRSPTSGHYMRKFFRILHMIASQDLGISGPGEWFCSSSPVAPPRGDVLELWLRPDFDRVLRIVSGAAAKRREVSGIMEWIDQ